MGPRRKDRKEDSDGRVFPPPPLVPCLDGEQEETNGKTNACHGKRVENAEAGTGVGAGEAGED